MDFIYPGAEAASGEYLLNILLIMGVLYAVFGDEHLKSKTVSRHTWKQCRVAFI